MYNYRPRRGCLRSIVGSLIFTPILALLIIGVFGFCNFLATGISPFTSEAVRTWFFILCGIFLAWDFIAYFSEE